MLPPCAMAMDAPPAGALEHVEMAMAATDSATTDAGGDRDCPHCPERAGAADTHATAADGSLPTAAQPDCGADDPEAPVAQQAPMMAALIQRPGAFDLMALLGLEHLKYNAASEPPPGTAHRTHLVYHRFNE